MTGKEIADLSEELGNQIVIGLRRATERALWQHTMPDWSEYGEWAADVIHRAFRELAEEKPAPKADKD